MSRLRVMTKSACSIVFLLFITSAAIAAKNPEIAAAANAEVEATVETIKTLTLIDSASNNAKGLAQVAAILDSRLKELGFSTRRETSPADVNADSVVGVKLGTGVQKVMLIAHMDTVYEVGALDASPVRIDNEKMYGPGVVDNKGGIGIILHSLQLLDDLAWTDYDTLTVLFNPDEEIGSAGSGALISELTADMDTVLSFEIGGSHKSGWAWLLLGAAAYAEVTMTVKGLASHAGGSPEKGRNAILELAHQLLATRKVATGIPGAQLNWTNVVSDKAFNQIPDLAVARGDGRITVEGAEIRLLEALQKKVAESKLIPQTETTVSVEITNPNYVANAKGYEVAKLMQKIFSEISYQTMYLVPMVKGVSHLGYASRSEDIAVLEGLGPSGEDVHSTSEYLDTRSLAPKIYTTVRLLMELGTEAGN